jgi:hypothetical protein
VQTLVQKRTSNNRVATTEESEMITPSKLNTL